MTAIQKHYQNIPEYYPYMYLDGYTPQEILCAAHRSQEAAQEIDQKQLEKALEAALDNILKDWK